MSARACCSGSCLHFSIGSMFRCQMCRLRASFKCHESKYIFHMSFVHYAEFRETCLRDHLQLTKALDRLLSAAWGGSLLRKFEVELNAAVQACVVPILKLWVLVLVCGRRGCRACFHDDGCVFRIARPVRFSGSYYNHPIWHEASSEICWPGPQSVCH